MRRPRINPKHIERAKAIRRKRAEHKLGRPMTEEEWNHHQRKGLASKWARGGKR